jgi:hypothetical protein
MTFQYLQDHFDLLQELAQTRELLAHTAKKLSSSPELRSSLEVV